MFTKKDFLLLEDAINGRSAPVFPHAGDNAHD
jgi:hypothetical protein